ncbi:hypothetical protein Ac2012v2_006576 [Leucoagaricus gongylophorus]
MRRYLVSLTRSATAEVISRRSYASVAGEASSQNWPLATAEKTASSKHLSPNAKPPGGPVARKSTLHDSKQLDISGRGDSIARRNPYWEKGRGTEMTPQDQMNELDNIIKYAQWFPTTDVWGQKVPTLDVMIPHNIVSLRHRSNGLKAIWYQFLENRQNDTKNAFSLITLAKENALPGVDTRSDGFFKKFFIWPLRVFGTTSMRPTSWIAPTRQMFLEIYQDLCTAIAKNNLREIKRLTTDSFANETLTAQKKHKLNCSYIWRFHREINPTQVLSLRVTEGYLAPEEPRFGNRLMVQALVKFDTEQSLEIYDRGGNPLHEPAESSVRENGRVPAKTRHVMQYLVFEKRMWYDGPWVIREQIWDIIPKTTD